MNSLTVYSKLLNIPIVNGIIDVPDDYKFMELQPNIREIIYTYFYLVNKQFKGLNWKLIGKYMNEDSNVKFIECVDPEIYYENNIVLSKWHKQDYDLITNNTKNIKAPIKYSNIGWNLNHYYDIKLLSLVEIAEVPHASKVVKLEYIQTNPDIFDIQTIYDRFNTNFNPNWFNKKNNQNKYRMLCLNGKNKINYNDEQWYSNSYSVLLSILSHEPKILHPIFEECALECNDVKGISEHYLKWFIDNRDSKFMFPRLLCHAKDINQLFELGLYVPTTGLESFNYNYKNITIEDVLKIMPDFTNKVWTYFKNEDVYNMFTKYNVEFRWLSKRNCIAFFNTFYRDDIEFYNNVFYNKSFRIDDVNSINHLSYEQAKSILETWNEKRGSLSTLYSVLMLKVDYIDLMKLHNEGLYNIELKLLKQKFDVKYHDIISEFVIKNKIVIEDHDDIELLKRKELSNNVSWKTINNKIKFSELFSVYLENNVNKNYDECKEQLYDYFDALTSDHIKIIPLDLLLYKPKKHIRTYNQNFVKSLLYNNQLKHMFEICLPRDLSNSFDEIYNKVVDEKYVMNAVESSKFLAAYIMSTSELQFEDVYKLVFDGDYTNLGCIWIENKHCDPPFELWPTTPNKKLQDAYIEYISSTLPQEYTERRFYDYMMKNKSKRSTDCTAIYTLFSNNNEHKIIFIDDNNLLESPAKKRMTIPIKYELVKTFFGEELDTNNVTMLSKISGSDFDKICGGNHLIDCFVYSDIKNIYRERTPLKQILDFFVNVMQIKFNIKVTYE